MAQSWRCWWRGLRATLPDRRQKSDRRVRALDRYSTLYKYHTGTRTQQILHESIIEMMTKAVPLKLLLLYCSIIIMMTKAVVVLLELYWRFTRMRNRAEGVRVQIIQI